VDLSYRYLTAVQLLRRLIQTGDLGRVFAIEATFHNAYSPDKTWSRDYRVAGGGCLLDLGSHLVDLSLWLLNFPTIADVSGRLLSSGVTRRPGTTDLEDYATATLTTAAGTIITVTCSWNLAIGQDAVIRVACYGTRGGAAVENVQGSFYDFSATRFCGSSRQALADPPDAWGGRALETWVQQMALSPEFDSRAEEFVEVARILDRVYAA
jgi:predicted dehydrogenase